MNTVEKEIGFFESFDKTPIYYEVRGKGEPLILIYGIACLINHWHFQIEYFAKNYKVITFDIRGHHKSQPLGNPQNLKISDLVKDIICLLEHLNISKAHFAGHSFGAPLLLELFRMKPELVGSLIFINGFSK
ncbi:MAG: alpha/beta fold hydrolase, partial [Pseudobdellovibrionaceae bacterium]